MHCDGGCIWKINYFINYLKIFKKYYFKLTLAIALVKDLNRIRVNAINAMGMRTKLLNCPRAECIARANHNAEAILDEPKGNLRQVGTLADAVDAAKGD